MIGIEGHIVVYGEGAQTLRTVALDRRGEPVVPSAATYSIVALFRASTADTRTVQASTAATIDSVSTTISAAGGPDTANPREISATSAAGILAGHRYLLGDGPTEEVAVEALNGTTLTLERAPLYSHASGAALVGLEISGTFPAAEVNDEDNVKGGGGPYAVIWDLTIAGETQVTRELVWIRRSHVRPFLTLTDATKPDPTITVRLGDRSDPDLLLQVAHEDYRNAIRKVGRDPADFYSREVGASAVRARFLLLASMILREEDNRQFWRDEWDSEISSIQIGRHAQGTVLTDRDSDTADEGSSTAFSHPFTLS